MFLPSSHKPGGQARGPGGAHRETPSRGASFFWISPMVAPLNGCGVPTRAKAIMPQVVLTLNTEGSPDSAGPWEILKMPMFSCTHFLQSELPCAQRHTLDAPRCLHFERVPEQTLTFPSRCLCLCCAFFPECLSSRLDS